MSEHDAKSEKLLEGIGFLDDDLLSEAEAFRLQPEKTEARKNRYPKPVRIAAIAACAAVFLFSVILLPRFFLRMGGGSSDQAATLEMAAETTGSAAASAEAEAPVNGADVGVLTEEAATEEAVPETAAEEAGTAVTTEEAAADAAAKDAEVSAASEEAAAGAASNALTAGAASDASSEPAEGEYDYAGFILPESVIAVTWNGRTYRSVTEDEMKDLQLPSFNLKAPAGQISASSSQEFVGLYLFASYTSNLIAVQTTSGYVLFIPAD
ncbi:MAG: hypothetical protein J6P72_01115 [Firmicutes bacterium]|nr:hypothetical protein [Bacillota bacterium]